MKPSFKLEVVRVDADLADDDRVELVLRVRASWLFVSAGAVFTVWANPRTRRGGVKAQTAI